MIGKYGLIAIREFVEAECKATWEYLKTIYSSPSTEKPSVSEHAILTETQPITELTEKSVEDAEKVPIVKKLIQRKPVKVIDFLTSSQPEPDNQPKNTLIVEKEPVLEEEHEEEEFEEEEQTEQEDDTTIKEVTAYRAKTKEERDEEKRNHKDAVRTKREELQKQGIRPSSLLTKENLKKWLDQGMSYQRIAREKVGLNETIISQEAEKHGMKSQIAGMMRRKGMI